MLKDGWLNREGVLYGLDLLPHSAEAKRICAEAKSEIDAEKALEGNGWVRIRHGIPFYSSNLLPTDIQKRIVVDAYYADLEHYRSACLRGAAWMFSWFFDDEEYDKLKRGIL